MGTYARVVVTLVAFGAVATIAADLIDAGTVQTRRDETFVEIWERNHFG